MSGSGNLLLKSKKGSAAANDGGIPNAGVLAEGMPALQLIGLPPVNENIGSGVYPGHAIGNVSNRLWIGMNRTAWNELGASSDGWATGTGSAATPGPVVGQIYGPNITAQGATRPIWMGAEIRAQEPLVKGGVDPTSSNALTYTILKASWDATTNDYLATFNPVDAGRGTVYASDVVLVTQRAIYNYVEGRLAESAGGFATQYASKTDAAMLGEEGVSKGTQTFLSPINIEQKLTVNGYTVDEITYPATIYSDNTEASIFDENITTLSIGGSASTITLGDASTSGSTITTIYGSTIINGSLQATEIDGGSF